MHGLFIISHSTAKKHANERKEKTAMRTPKIKIKIKKKKLKKNKRGIIRQMREEPKTKKKKRILIIISGRRKKKKLDSDYIYSGRDSLSLSLSR